MKSFELDVVATRGGVVESRHHVHAAVVDALAARDRIRYQYALQSHLHVGVKTFAEPETPVLA